jgi:hypothetical protein
LLASAPGQAWANGTVNDGSPSFGPPGQQPPPAEDQNQSDDRPETETTGPGALASRWFQMISNVMQAAQDAQRALLNNIR